MVDTDVYVPDIVPESDREYVLTEAHHGSRVGWGKKPAVLVVDMTEAFVQQRPEIGANCVSATARVIEAARAAESPVIHAVPIPPAEHPDGYPAPVKAAPVSDRGPELGDLSPNGEAWLAKIDDVVSPVEPAEDETVIEKPRASAFFDTHLSNLLHYHGVDTLVVTGTTTSGCVRATVVDSHSSNFRTIVPPECVTDRTSISHEVALFDMDMRYADVTPVDQVIEQFQQGR